MKKKKNKSDAVHGIDPEREANRILIRRLLAKPMRERMNFLRVKLDKGSSL
jgi:hypothetical protein